MGVWVCMYVFEGVYVGGGACVSVCMCMFMDNWVWLCICVWECAFVYA